MKRSLSAALRACANSVGCINRTFRQSNLHGAPRSSAFQRWFGRSVVVNPDGSPKVVYHGTDSPEFDVFSLHPPITRRQVRLLGDGIYFTDDLEQAAKWGRRVIPVYLRIENPRTQHDGVLVPKTTEQDGAIVTGGPGSRSGETWYVVRSPAQIKSAVSNDGSYSVDDLSILSGLRSRRAR